MNWSMVLFGVMPLVIFVVVDSYSGLKAGIIWACVFAFAELIYSLVVFKRIDELTICTILMVVIFGLLSLRSNNPIFLKCSQ